MTAATGLDADLARLADLLDARALEHLTDRERCQIAGLQVRLIRARLAGGVYAAEAAPQPWSPACGREIVCAPWN